MKKFFFLSLSLFAVSSLMAQSVLPNNTWVTADNNATSYAAVSPITLATSGPLSDAGVGDTINMLAALLPNDTAPNSDILLGPGVTKTTLGNYVKYTFPQDKDGNTYAAIFNPDDTLGFITASHTTTSTTSDNKIVTNTELATVGFVGGGTPYSYAPRSQLDVKGIHSTIPVLDSPMTGNDMNEDVAAAYKVSADTLTSQLQTKGVVPPPQSSPFDGLGGAAGPIILTVDRHPDLKISPSAPTPTTPASAATPRDIPPPAAPQSAPSFGRGL